MLANTALIAMLSVAFAEILITSLTLNCAPAVGRTLKTLGFVISSTTKLVISLLLTLLDESFAMKVILYVPIRLGAIKETLYLAPTELTNINCSFVPLG